MLDMGFIKILYDVHVRRGCGLFPHTSHIVSGKVSLALGRPGLSPVPLPLPAPPGAALLEVARLALRRSRLQFPPSRTP